MELSQYTKTGNTFFEERLKNYRKLGMTYLDFWNKAYFEYIHDQSGGTDQGIAHTRDVEHNIWVLIEKYIEWFPDEVLYILSLSSALHDCAKKANDTTDHALKGSQIIKDDLTKKSYVNLQETANAIADIVSVHQSGNFKILTEEIITLSGQPIRIKDCAAIFRLADMMSTTAERSVRAHAMLGLPATTLDPFLNSVRSYIHNCQPSTKDRTELEIGAHPDDIKSKRNIDLYIKALNKDMTEEHKKILQNAKVIYLTEKFKIEEKEISLPYTFVLSKHSFIDDILRDKRPFTIKEGISRLVPCYFHNKETDIDIYSQFMESIEKDKSINSKFLYWTLRGTKEYLTLCKDPKYLLSKIAHDLLKENFPKIYPIINSDKNLLHIVDLGVGDGQEINIILNSLISDSDITNDTKIYCSLIDSSYHMLRVAVNIIDEANLSNRRYKENVEIVAINCDLRDLHLYKGTLKFTYGSRLFCLLGGTLGNFCEKEVIEPIEKEMSDMDFFLLGVDLIGNRTDEQIISAYDNIIDKKFVFNPLAEIGYNFEQSNFVFEIKNDVSEVGKAKTVIARCLVGGQNIQMGKSTKYTLKEIKDYLQNNFNFEILNEIVDSTQNYALLLLKKIV